MLLCIFNGKLNLTSKKSLTWLQNDRWAEQKQNIGKIICKNTSIITVTVSFSKETFISVIHSRYLSY